MLKSRVKESKGIDNTLYLLAAFNICNSMKTKLFPFVLLLVVFNLCASKRGNTQTPIASFYSNITNICPGECVSFGDNSTNIPTSWAWSFPGGTPSSSTLQNPVNICYYNPGVYNVTLTVSNSLGSDTKVDSSYITVDSCVSPQVFFTASETTICKTHCVDFTDYSTNSPTSWIWTFQGGNPSSSTQKNPGNICYSDSGTYNVTLSVFNSYGASVLVENGFMKVNTCTSIENMKLEDKIRVYPNPNNGKFIVEIKNGQSFIELKVIDQLGKVVRMEPEVKEEYVIENLASGLYTVIITFEDGVVYQKVVVN